MSLLKRVGSSRSTVSKEYKCTVQLLDDSQTIAVDFKKDDTGQLVLDYVCHMLNVVEKDYFGLRYVDSNRHRYWLDTTKPILKQVGGAPIIFAFRVQYYPIDPSILHEQLTRYLITMQMKRDLLHGRLYCPQNDAAILGAYIVQAELGDYDVVEHKAGYVSQFKLFLNQTPRLEDKIALEHQKLKGKGMTPADADFEFLKKACALDTYGYYPFTVKDAKNGQVYVGATPRGLLIYQAHKKLHHLRWHDVKGFDYAGKEFFVYASEEYFNEHNVLEQEMEDNVALGAENGNQSTLNRSTNDADIVVNKTGGKKKPCLRFVCPSGTFCKHLWKYMLGQQAFFTQEKAVDVKPIVIRRGPIFKRATFRYNGRVLQEIKEGSSPKRAEPSFERVHIQRQMPRDERNAPWANKFHTLPRTMKAVPEETTDILNRTAPNIDTSFKRNSLLVETTSQKTPAVTPMASMSPLTENGPWTGAGNLSNGPSDKSFSMVQTSSTTSNKSGYQSEVITVCLKRVEHTEQNANDDLNASTQEPQRIVKTSTTTVATTTKEKNGNVVEEKTRSPILIDDEPAAGRALNRSTILTGLMFVVLVFVTVVFVMEIQDAEFRRYVRQLTGDDAFRRHVYDPVRQRFVDTYGRLFK